MGLHNHDEHSHGSGVHVPAYLWKMLALVGSVYAFYLLELALTQLSIHSNKVKIHIVITREVCRT